MKQKKPVYKRVWFWVLIVFVIGGLGSALGDSDDDKPTDTPSGEVGNKDDEKNEEEKEVLTKIGQTLEVGKVSYVVNSVEVRGKVGNEHINQEAKGIYLILEISITNNGDEALTISDSYFNLEFDGKTYSADSTATLYVSTENDSESIWYEELNPDLTLTGKIAFDVTETVANSNESKLKVQTGFWGTQTGYISLAR